MSVQAHGYRNYWIIWGVLLVLTIVMIFIGEAEMSEIPHALLLLLGSAVKASLIMFYFMHLRFERFGLVMIVLLGIFLTGFLMFALPAYDGTQIFERVMYR